MRKEKISEMIEGSHKLMNEVVLDTAGMLSESYFMYKIDDLLRERGITQKELAMMTGMRVGTISELVNGKKKGINLNKIQLVALMVALRVTKLSDILEIRIPEEQLLKYQKEQAEWILEKEMPIELKEMYRANVLKMNNLE